MTNVFFVPTGAIAQTCAALVLSQILVSHHFGDRIAAMARQLLKARYPTNDKKSHNPVPVKVEHHSVHPSSRSDVNPRRVARQRIAARFKLLRKEPDLRNRENICRTILCLLTKFPTLAMERFLETSEDLSPTTTQIPLILFAAFGAPLKQVQQVQKLMCPPTSNDLLGSYELSTILKMGHVALDVIDFLVRTYPASLLQRDSLGDWPILTFIQCALSPANIEVKRLNPGNCLYTSVPIYDSTLFDEVIEFMMETNPVSFDDKLLQLVCSLVPPEKQEQVGAFFRASSNAYTNRGAISPLEQLSCVETSGSGLRILTCALFCMAKSKVKLRKLHLSLPCHVFGPRTTMLSVESLHQVLANSRLEDLYLNFAWGPLPQAEVWKIPKYVEAFFQTLLQSDVSQLKSLKLVMSATSRPRIDVTQNLATVLERAYQLEQLSIGGCFVAHVPTICNRLVGLHKLRRLHFAADSYANIRRPYGDIVLALKTMNSNLRDCSIHNPVRRNWMWDYRNNKYLLTLSGNGKLAAQESSTTKAEFVTVLAHLITFCAISLGQHDLEALNCCYLLLQENPSRWST